MPCFWLNSPEQLPLPGLLAMRNVRYAQPSITRSRAVSLNITLAACALASETWSDLGDTNGIPTVPIGMCQNCRKWCFVIIKDIGVHHGSPTIFPSNSWTCLFIRRIWLLTLECFWYWWDSQLESSPMFHGENGDNRTTPNPQGWSYIFIIFNCLLLHPIRSHHNACLSHYV